MTEPSPQAAVALLRRFSLVIEGLCRAVATRAAAERALAPLLLLLWNRLRRLPARFAAAVTAGRAGAAAARVAAETLPRRAARGPEIAVTARLPRGFGWLLRLAPEAAPVGAQLQHLLADAAMADLLARAPGAGRVLRPLCWMLAVPPGPALLPRAARKRPPRPAPTGVASTANAPGRRRERVPRTPGRAWLRWRPVADGG